MSNLLIGVLCMLFSLFLFFLSPKENKNMFGYKSPQQGFHKNIWKWSVYLSLLHNRDCYKCGRG